MNKYIICGLSGLLLASCVDTNVLPEDMIVGEDFWQTREDVSMMVAGAYYAMGASAAIQRVIVWGSARSDELTPTTQTISNNDTYTYLTEMNAGTMDDENVYADWASFYTVINRCNQVLDRAAGVMDIDPSYTESTYNTDRSQMLALRALCYFYLVRAFRDVPYSGTAYYTTSQDMDLPQEAPGTVLQYCIDDLTEALKTPLSATSYEDWRKTGYLNKNAIQAILADVYLWRASMTGSTDDYQNCADLCQEIIEDKIAAAENNQMSSFLGGVDIDGNSGYPLYDGATSNEQIFINGNSDESLFELAFGESPQQANTGLAAMYVSYANSSSYIGRGYLEPSQNVFSTNNTSDTESASQAFYTSDDYRFGESTLNVVASGGTTTTTTLAVRKMIDQTTYSQTTAASDRIVSGISYLRNSGNVYSSLYQNWIFYRITDVMLMRAEALVQLATSDDDSRLGSAFHLVQTVNSRSLDNSVVASDSLVFSDYSDNTKSSLEELVLAERLRELCYEGKRWFDLMRYNYRHCTGTVEIDKTMNEILEENGGSVSAYPVQTYEQFITFVLRKSSSTGVQKAGLVSEPYLYFPVYEDEMNVNVNLNQNPAYSNSGTYERK